MTNYQRFATKRPLSQRVFDYCESSWVPALAFYACLAAVWIAANWQNL